MKKAFTMIELIFVIVILGVLSAVAIPKFAKTKEMADVSKGRSDVAAIRSSILTEKQSNLIKGINTFIPKLSANSTMLFTGDGTRTLMTYGIVAGTNAGKWSASGISGTTDLYDFKVDTTDIRFTYDSDDGTFICDRDDTDSDKQKFCRQLID